MIHRAINYNNFNAIIQLLGHSVCDPSARNAEGWLALDICGQMPFLGKILRQAEKECIRKKVSDEDRQLKASNPIVPTHFCLNVISRKGFFYTKKRFHQDPVRLN